MEHANLAVSDIDRLSDFLQALLGWRVRWRGPAMNGGETIHVGTDAAYLALYTNPQVKARGRSGSGFRSTTSACRSTTWIRRKRW